MRLRHIPGSEEEIEKSPYVVHEPTQYKGKWNTLFGNDNPIEIEIGMGKGKFIMELALSNPDRNYVGIERYSSVLLRGLQKRAAMQEELNNIWFMCVDAKELADIFEVEEVSKIYLNFSDPWPKDRYAKRRLTSENFMKVYDKILKADGVVEFKTDNKELFEYSLTSIPDAGWKIDMEIRDLHNSPYAKENIMTEYEAKFSEKGNPIYKLVARRRV